MNSHGVRRPRNTDKLTAATKFEEIKQIFSSSRFYIENFNTFFFLNIKSTDDDNSTPILLTSSLSRFLYFITEYFIRINILIRLRIRLITKVKIYIYQILIILSFILYSWFIE